MNIRKLVFYNGPLDGLVKLRQAPLGEPVDILSLKVSVDSAQSGEALGEYIPVSVDDETCSMEWRWLEAV